MSCFFYRILKWGLGCTIALLSLLLFVVLIIRLLFAVIPGLHQNLATSLSNRFDTEIQVDEVVSDWNFGSPKLTLRGLSLRRFSSDEPALSIEELDMEIDLRSSLLNRTPVF